MSACDFTEIEKWMARTQCDIDPKRLILSEKLSAIFGELSAMSAIFFGWERGVNLLAILSFDNISSFQTSRDCHYKSRT